MAITYTMIEMRFDGVEEAAHFFAQIGADLKEGAAKLVRGAVKVAAPKELPSPVPVTDETDAEAETAPPKKTRKSRKKAAAKDAPAADVVTLDMIRPVMNDILKADPEGGPDSIMGVFGKFRFTEDGKTRPVTKLGQLDESDYPAMHAEMSALLA